MTRRVSERERERSVRRVREEEEELRCVSFKKV